MAEILQEYIDVLPAILEAIDLDAMAAVTDGSKFVAYFPGKTMKADVRAGTELPKTDPLYNVCRTGRKTSSIVPESIYGFTFKSISMPIFDNGKVAGALGIAVSLKKDTEIQKYFKEMRGNMDEIHGDIEEVRDFTLNVGKEVDIFTGLLKDISDNFGSMKKSAEGIQSIATQSNILSLNASIEAARAGEQGRGFAVVAKQMQEHSNSTKRSSEEVVSILDKIHRDVIEVNKNLLELKESFSSQSAAIDGMGETLSKLRGLSDSLAGIIEQN